MELSIPQVLQTVQIQKSCSILNFLLRLYPKQTLWYILQQILIWVFTSDTHYKPKICSISWGNAEPLWLTSSRTALNSILRHAAQQEISVFAASGDSGSSDAIGDTQAHVDFPGSSPYCVSCGGTNLQIENGLI
jgi:subtilase family serine protease